MHRTFDKKFNGIIKPYTGETASKNKFYAELDSRLKDMDHVLDTGISPETLFNEIEEDLK